MVKRFFQMAVGSSGDLFVDPFKERLNYVVTEGKFVGATVNIPIIAQADTLEELTHKIKAISKMYIQHMADALNQDEPFDVRQLSIDEWDKLK